MSQMSPDTACLDFERRISDFIIICIACLLGDNSLAVMFSMLRFKSRIALKMYHVVVLHERPVLEKYGDNILLKIFVIYLGPVLKDASVSEGCLQ